MTFRVYVRWPSQRTSDKTTTDSEGVARVAFNELRERSDLRALGALGISMTKDNRQVAYINLRSDSGGNMGADQPG